VVGCHDQEDDGARRRCGASCLVSVSLLLGSLPLATAANILVTSTADTLTASDGACTLREAILNANTDSDTTAGDCAAGSTRACPLQHLVPPGRVCPSADFGGPLIVGPRRLSLCDGMRGVRIHAVLDPTCETLIGRRVRAARAATAPATRTTAGAARRAPRRRTRVRV